MSFATDLIKWAEKMGERGRNLLLWIDLGEADESMVDYMVFEDADPVGRFLEKSAASEPDFDSVMYSWVGDRTVVHGTPDQLALLTAAISRGE